jgi:hypothetical protein
MSCCNHLLVIIKRLFDAEYMQEMTVLTPYVQTKFHDFSVYLISRTWNAFQNFSRDQRGHLPKRVLPQVSTDRVDHVGPSLGQVGPVGWLAGPTLAPTDLHLGCYLVYEVAMRKLALPSWFAHKSLSAIHVVASRLSTSTKLPRPSQWTNPGAL